MAEDKSPKKSPESNDTAFLVLLALAVALLVLLPALLATAIYLPLRRRLRRTESIILMVTGLVGFAMNAKGNFVDYAQWLVVLVSGDILVKDVGRLDVPFMALGFMALALAGLALSVQNSRITELGMTRIGKKTEAFKRTQEQRWGKGNIKGTESILPTDREKASASRIVPPGGNLMVKSSEHSILSSGSKTGKRSFPIGLDKRGTPFMLLEDEIRMHTLIFGSTGSGKSKTIEAFAGGLLDLGWDGMIVDLKEDTKPGGLRDWCHDYAAHHAKPYQELRLSDPNPKFWFNPLAGMGPDEIRDTILSLNEFEAAYWESINKKMLGQVVNLFMDAHEVDPISFPFPTMRDLGIFMASASLPNAAKKMSATVISAVAARTKDDYDSVLQPNKDQQTSAAGLGSKLTLIYDTNVGRTVLQAGGNRQAIDVTTPGLTYVGLDSQGKPDLSKIISSAVLQRMSVYSSQRTTGAQALKTPNPRFLIIDEANWIDKNIVQNLLSRARGAGIAMILATQGPMDWIDPKGGNAFATLSQNANVCIAMAQGEPLAAEMLAEYIGKKEKMQIMQTLVNDELQDAGGARMMVDYIVQPDDLRRLGIGEAIIRVGKPAERISWVSVKMRDPKAIAGR